jgi:hypothetical protein
MHRWKAIDGRTQALLVPGGMIVLHIHIPDSELGVESAGMVFVPVDGNTQLDFERWLDGEDV